MYDVIFYKDRAGKEPIKEYIYELKAKASTSKQDRIQFEKIMAYIGALQEYGTRIGQPTPTKEIERARSNLKDFGKEQMSMSVNINGEEFTTFNDIMNDDSLVTPAERDTINFEVALIGKLIEAREQKGISQKELADLAGVKQPAIARLESMKATPQIDTLFKVLKPLGYTLAIVPDTPTS